MKVKNIIFATLSAISFSIAFMNVWSTFKIPYVLSTSILAFVTVGNLIELKRNVWRQQLLSDGLSLVATILIVYMVMLKSSFNAIIVTITTIVSGMVLSCSMEVVFSITKKSKSKADIARQYIMTIINSVGVYYAVLSISKSEYLAAVISAIITVLPFAITATKNKEKHYLAAITSIVFGAAFGCYAIVLGIWLNIFTSIIQLVIYWTFYNCFVNTNKKRSIFKDDALARDNEEEHFTRNFDIPIIDIDREPDFIDFGDENKDDENVLVNSSNIAKNTEVKADCPVKVERIENTKHSARDKKRKIKVRVKSD